MRKTNSNEPVNLETQMPTINEESNEHLSTQHVFDPLLSSSPKKQRKVAKNDSDSSSDDGDKPEKAKWVQRNNEIDELKKIFFEFLMKW